MISNRHKYIFLYLEFSAKTLINSVKRHTNPNTMLCWQSEILINKHKHNKVYCINIKIEDHILKYRVYPKPYESWYQLGDFQLHPISKDQTSVRKQNQHQNNISSMSLFCHSIPNIIKITSLYNTTSLLIQFFHKCLMRY